MVLGCLLMCWIMFLSRLLVEIICDDVGFVCCVDRLIDFFG